MKKPFIFEDKQFDIIIESESMKNILKNEYSIQELISDLKYFYSLESN